MLHCMNAFIRSRGQPRRDDKLRGRILANDGIGVAEPDALETPSAPSLETFSQTKVLPVFGCMGLGPIQPKTGNTLRILSLEYLIVTFHFFVEVIQNYTIVFRHVVRGVPLWKSVYQLTAIIRNGLR